MNKELKITKKINLNMLLPLVAILIGMTMYFAKSILSKQIEISDFISGFADGLSMTILYSGLVLLIFYFVRKIKMNGHNQ